MIKDAEQLLEDRIEAQRNRKKYSKREGDIIKHLFYQGTATVRELSHLLDVTHPTATKLIEELTTRSVIIPHSESKSSGGRRSVQYALNPAAGYILCVDAGRLNTKLAIMDLSAEIVVSREFRSRVFSRDDGFLQLLIDTMNEMITEKSIPDSAIIGMGIGVPGFVNTSTGESFSFLNYFDQPIGKVLEASFGVPVVVSNDVNLMAHAEHHFGVAKDSKDALILNLGWGIGLGLLLNGSVYLGAEGFAGEFGHIQVDPHGEQCQCGKNGCLETVASGESIARIAVEKLRAGEKSLLGDKDSPDMDAITARKIVSAAKEGDEFSIKLLHESGKAIGKTLAGVIQILNPGLIILGGKHARAGELLTNSIENSLLQHVNPKLRENIRILRSTLDENSNILGAAGLVIEKIIYPLENS